MSSLWYPSRRKLPSRGKISGKQQIRSGPEPSWLDKYSLDNNSIVTSTGTNDDESIRSAIDENKELSGTIIKSANDRSAKQTPEFSLFRGSKKLPAGIKARLRYSGKLSEIREDASEDSRNEKNPRESDLLERKQTSRGKEKIQERSGFAPIQARSGEMHGRDEFSDSDVAVVQTNREKEKNPEKSCFMPIRASRGKGTTKSFRHCGDEFSESDVAVVAKAEEKLRRSRKGFGIQRAPETNDGLWRRKKQTPKLFSDESSYAVANSEATIAKDEKCVWPLNYDVRWKNLKRSKRTGTTRSIWSESNESSHDHTYSDYTNTASKILSS